MEPISILGEIGKVLSFLSFQYFIGRKASFPYGFLLHFSLFKIFIIIVLSDILLTLFLLNGLEIIFHKIKLLRKIKSNIQRKLAKKKKNNKIFIKLKKFVPLSLFVISANPYVGGSFWGSIYVYSINIRKATAFFIINFGCILCTFIYCVIIKSASTLF